MFVGPLLRGRIGEVEVGEGLPVRVVGVINLSPESFYRGSVREKPEEAAELALELVNEGADVIDVGGMSSAPYKETYVSEKVEMERVVGAIRRIRELSDVTISIDTYRAKVAEAALKAGANAVNDVSGLAQGREMCEVIKEHGASIILVARRDGGRGRDPITKVRGSLKCCLEDALKWGLEPEDVVLDPGIGFFREEGMPWYEWDVSVLAGLRRLFLLGRPILVGTSRKSFIGAILGQEDPEDRLIGSVVTEAVAVFNGAHAVRTHDVREALQAVRLAEKMRKEVKFKEGRVIGVDLTRLIEEGDEEVLLGWLGVGGEAIKALSRKLKFRVLFLRSVPDLLATIMKQEMLYCIWIGKQWVSIWIKIMNCYRK